MAGLLNLARQAGEMNPRRRGADESIFANRQDADGELHPADLPGRGQPGDAALERIPPNAEGDEDLPGAPGKHIAEGSYTRGGIGRKSKGLMNVSDAAAEQPDFSDRYNTKLSPEDEAKFQDAAKKNPKLLHDTFDYDTRGDWKATGNKVDERGHGGDTFKKPNHPTFSDQSRYHGVDGHQGGKWSQQGDGKWNYEASHTNVEMHGKEGLRNYFGKYERGNAVTLPEDAPGNQNMTPEQADKSGAAVFR